MISPAISGSGKNEVSHVIVKPTEKGLETTLAIYTDRRSYHINLKSVEKKYFPLVSFAYKDQLDAQWSAYKEQKRDQVNASRFATGDGVANIDNLNFNYKISGSAKWKPTRVYNNGIKIY
jgi:type IV secretion system protein VirB9